MKKSISERFAKIAVFSTLFFSTVAMAEKFAIQSNSFKDGQKVPLRHAGTDAQCGGGEGLSPDVRWSNLPEGTKSLVVFLVDPDGQKGTGTSHWVVYNIPATFDGLSAGLKEEKTDSYTIGLNTMGQAAYRGLCAQASENSHHYTITVVATSIEAGSLPDGLTRQGLLEQIKGKTLLGQSIVGLYR